ncbi:hypothetical protein Pcinc_011781 [Petrolisthes cinctipes]|uniref:Uncharacterized protein n=1 Tax=Petrolisthes cinctipes TaxID=88211 RepID=A0AAE1KS58_PETCI|nr:hypothetical protein Pcinc_011781 [Petrolisthes cinctipes]
MKRSKREKMAEYSRYLKNITVFHTRKEVHDQLVVITPHLIEQIVNKIGLGKILYMFKIPKEDLVETFETIVFDNIQDPLQVVIRQMPKPSERLIRLSSNTPKDTSIIPEVQKLVKEATKKKEGGEEEEEEEGTASFVTLISKLQEIRSDILKQILTSIRIDFLWKDMPVNPIKRIKNKNILYNICQSIYTAIVPFAVGFTRFFIDDEEGFDEDLQEALEAI